MKTVSVLELDVLLLKDFVKTKILLKGDGRKMGIEFDNNEGGGLELMISESLCL